MATERAPRPQVGKGSGGAVPGHGVKDPGIVFGRFKVLQRTDHKFVVHDTEAPLGRGQVGELHDTKDDAGTAAKALHEGTTT